MRISESYYTINVYLLQMTYSEILTLRKVSYQHKTSFFAFKNSYARKNINNHLKKQIIDISYYQCNQRT